MPSPETLKSVPKPQRRSNVERSATTRAKVIEAAIQCLYELGYEGTTVILVAKRAGVSRGAAQHQFPSKVDLMIAVTDYVMDLQKKLRREIWEQLPENKGQVSHVVEASWKVQSQPENVALFEIMMATRNDEELNQRFAPFLKQMSELPAWGAKHVADVAGIDVQPELEAMARLHFAAMRGISLDYLLNKDEEGARVAIDLLIRFQRSTIAKVIEDSKGGNNHTARDKNAELVN